MNYAEDRLDRRATAKVDTTSHDQLEYDLKRAHSVLNKYYASHRHRGCDTLPSSHADDDDVDEASPYISPSLRELRAAHELAGKTLRDCGQNRQAVFHFGMAWRASHWLENQRRRNYGTTFANTKTINDDNNTDEDSEWKSVGDYAQMCEFSGFPEIGVLALLFYRAGGCIEFDSIKIGIDESDKIQLHGCGCNMSDCGRSPCFVAFPYQSTDMDDILLSMDALFIDNNFDQTFPCALDLLAHLAHMTRKADIIDDPTEAMHEYLSKQQSIKNMPSVLRFWDNGSLEQSEHRRVLSPVLLLLLLKLLYSSPISGSFLQLACISIPYVAARFPLASPEGRMLAQRYKSHWAYYVFIRALVLGERVKKHRKDRVTGQIPVWDIVFCKESETLNEKQIIDEDKRVNKLDYYRQILWVCSAESSGLSLDQTPPLPCTIEHRISPLSSHHPIFVVGDSHVLSLAWQTIHIDTSKNAPHTGEQQNKLQIDRTAVPFPATGMKAWHVRPSTRFFTHYNLHACLKRLPLSGTRRTIILSAGEIDCREGIGGPLLQGYYRNCRDAVTRTVAEYLASLSDLAEAFQLQILVMPVSPHAYRSEKNGKSTGRARRRETMHLWNESLRRELINGRMSTTPQSTNDRCKYDRVFVLDYEEQLRHDSNSPVGYVLHPCFNADYTHVNSAIVPLIEDAILNCGCDLASL
ncbi:hypothetical protein ACHAWU_007159 [Discostella pseudostelligera]|uniref:Uncharacterized protein n=1 Tax=Discostella pseudostelligera TaxID=259834 RepID=A0ABD3LXL7_9STRA